MRDVETGEIAFRAAVLGHWDSMAWKTC